MFISNISWNDNNLHVLGQVKHLIKVNVTCFFNVVARKSEITSVALHLSVGQSRVKWSLGDLK